MCLFHHHGNTGAAVVQRPLVGSEFNDTLFVMGGFGGWPEDDARYNGMRCRNDVYKTKDGGEGRTRRGGENLYKEYAYIYLYGM